MGSPMYGLILLASAAAAPCDIYAAGGTPCVAAHSMVRQLYDAYAGPLYRVRRADDNATLDVGVGGVARQDEFCARSLCRVARIFDQSSRENDLVVGIAGSSGGRRPDAGVVANRSLASAAGRPAYAAVFEGGEGYRTSGATGVATGDAPETVYAVLSGAYYNDACCFDYGNAYPDARDHGAGTMEAIYFGNKTKEKWSRGAGAGPWVQADLESGLWAGKMRPGSATRRTTNVADQRLTFAPPSFCSNTEKSKCMETNQKRGLMTYAMHRQSQNATGSRHAGVAS